MILADRIGLLLAEHYVFPNSYSGIEPIQLNASSGVTKRVETVNKLTIHSGNLQHLSQTWSSTKHTPLNNSTILDMNHI